MPSILPRLETNEFSLVEPAEAMPEAEVAAGIMASFAHCDAAFLFDDGREGRAADREGRAEHRNGEWDDGPHQQLGGP
jgi:hypothetical protein